MNANASTLTGAIATDPTSTTTVNLTNKTTWNLTGNSNVSNLSVNNSSIVFAPSTDGGFKTLTVGSYTGTGASITLNALLSGANPGADQIVINGGQATGTTTINIKSLGTIGAATTGSRRADRDDDQRRLDRAERVRARKPAGRRRLQYIAAERRTAANIWSPRPR